MAVVINVLSTFSDAGLQSAQKELDKFAKATETKMKRFGDAAGNIALGIGAGFAGAGAGLLLVGESFDEAFDTIRTGTGATGDALAGLQNDFKAVVSAVPASFGDASQAVTVLNQRLGLTGEPLQQIAGQMLELSRITGTELGANVESVAKLFQNFGVSAGDQSAKLDTLFRASQLSGLSVQSLSDTMAGAGVVLREVGFNFDQSAAFIATLGKAGVDASDVMPALAKSLAVAAKQGKDASTVFSETFAAIKNSASDTDAAGIALEIFGGKAGPRLAAMIREGKLSFEEMQAAISGGSETIMGAGADTEDFAEKFTKMKNRIMVAVEPLAGKVFGAIGSAMDSLGPKIEGLTKWMQQNSGIVKTLAIGLGGLAVVLGTVAIATKAVTVATNLYATATKVASGITKIWAGIQAAFNAIMAANPLVLIVLGIAALIAVLVVAYNKFEGFRNVVDAVFAGISAAVSFAWNNVIKPIWDLIYWYIENILVPYYTLLFNIAKKVFEGIGAAVSFVWNNVIKPVWDLIYWYIENILVPYWTLLFNIAKTVFEGIAAAISWAWENVIKPVWGFIQFYIDNVLVPVFNTIKDVVTAVFDIVGNVIQTAWNVISGAFNMIGDKIAWLVGTFGSIKDGISNAFGTIFDIVTGPFKSAFNFIADAWNNTVGQLSFTMPDWVPFIGGKGFDMPDIPKFHKGGIVPGPAGAEMLAVLEGGEMILPRNAVQSMAAGQSVNLVINTVAGNPTEIERIVVDAIARANRRGMTTLKP